MKRIISLLIAVVTAVLLVSCTPVTSNDNVNDSLVADTTADNSADNTDNQANETTENAVITQTQEISRGKTDGNIYENESLGLKFTKPDSWVYATDEEIATLMNLTVENILGDNFSQVLENNQVVFDMMVNDLTTGTNINLVYENLKKSMATNLTEKQYLDIVKEQFKNMNEMTVAFPDEYDTVKLGESEFTKAVCTTSAYGMEMTQVYYIRKIDAYMVVMTVTVTDGYSIEEIEKMFS